MGRWLQLDDKIINLDQVAYVAPHLFNRTGGEPIAGTHFAFVNPDCWVNTKKSVEEVFRLIEAAEGPEPPKPLVDHEFVPALGSVYECLDCTLPQKAHAR